MGEQKRRAALGLPPQHPNPSDERRLVWAWTKGDKPPTLAIGLTNATIEFLQSGGMSDVEFSRRQHAAVPYDLRVVVFSAPTRFDVMNMLGQANRMRATPLPEDVSDRDFQWTTNPKAVERVVGAARRYLTDNGLNLSDELLNGLVHAMARGEP
jgi:hypothetical protein